MGEGDLRYVARPPARPTQVHPDPHAEDGAVVVAEHVAVVEPVDEVPVLRKTEKRYKNSGLPFTAPKCVVDVTTRWPLDENANARLDDPPNDDHGV